MVVGAALKLSSKSFGLPPVFLKHIDRFSKLSTNLLLSPVQPVIELAEAAPFSEPVEPEATHPLHNARLPLETVVKLDTRHDAHLQEILLATCVHKIENN